MLNIEFEKSLKGLKKLDKEIEDDGLWRRASGCLILGFIPILIMLLLSVDIWGVLNGIYTILIIVIIVIALLMLMIK